MTWKKKRPAVGKSDNFEKAAVTYAAAHCNQAERDSELFRQASRTGLLTVHDIG
jgi:hypothetical protein